MLMFLWDAATEDYWHSQNEYAEYNDEGYLLTSLIQTWDEAQQEWVNEAVSEYSYNEQGQQASRLQQKWNLETDSWVGTNRHSVEYYKDDLVSYSSNEV